MIDNTVCPDRAVVAVDDACNGRQTDSRSSEIFVAVEAIESVEEPVGVKHVETSSIVSNKPCGLFLVPSKVNSAIWVFGAELN